MFHETENGVLKQECHELKEEILKMKLKQKDKAEKAAKVCVFAGQLKEARKSLKAELAVVKEKLELQTKKNRDLEK